MLVAPHVFYDAIVGNLQAMAALTAAGTKTATASKVQLGDRDPFRRYDVAWGSGSQSPQSTLPRRPWRRDRPRWSDRGAMVAVPSSSTTRAPQGPDAWGFSRESFLGLNRLMNEDLLPDRPCDGVGDGMAPPGSLSRGPTELRAMRALAPAA